MPGWSPLVRLLHASCPPLGAAPPPRAADSEIATAPVESTEQSEAFREHETSAVRTADARMSIDPGFVHHRLIQNLVGAGGVQVINEAVDQLPPELPDYVRRLQIDHIYVDAVITLCSAIHVPTLSQLLAAGNGRLFASVETVQPCPAVYEAERVSVEIDPSGTVDMAVALEFATKCVVADTTRMEIAQGSDIAIVGLLRRVDWSARRIILEPLIIGGPSLESASPDLPPGEAMWLGHSFGEVFAEDIDEFSDLANVPAPSSIEPMKKMTERAVKQCLAEILGQEAPKDWAGEQSDLYSAHLHLNGRHVTGAFLLKGPASFRPMRLNHLGANNDQIVRLSNEPADLLVVQHSHEIGTDVRTTLRAFANGLGTVRRRYCLIDGADTLRVLTAYNKLDRAVELSATERAERAKKR